MVTSLGQYLQSCRAARAGLRRIEEWEDYSVMGLDEEFDPRESLQIAPAPLPRGAPNQWDRLVELSLPAIEEALFNARINRRELPRIRFSVCLSASSGKGDDPELGGYYLDALHGLGALPAFRESGVYFQGHAAGAVALAEACNALRGGEYERCLLGGAESFFDSEMLDRLDREFRLKGPRSPDGYIPGEAAVFCMLEREDRARRRGVVPLLAITGCGFAAEPRREPGEVSTAGALCDAVRAAAEAANSAGAKPPSGWVLSDFNGERHRAREWGLAVPRLNRLLGDDLIHWHPAQSFGDVGSASAALLLGMAASAYQDARAPRPSALILSSSDGPDRAAILAQPAGNKA
jgi:3-oxoacyl-[acyl-carrier-protein] synthase-1